MKVPRKDLLNRLLSVEAGMSRGKSIAQSDCVVLGGGWFYTMSQEAACACPSGLDPSWEGALRADKLVAILKGLPEGEVEVDLSPKALKLRTRGRWAEFALEGETLLPVGEVERPGKADWQALPGDFGEAAALAGGCVGPSDGTVRACVHVHPDYLEACDNLRLVRYSLKTFVSGSVLTRGGGLKKIADLGMTRGAETPNWLHFRNPLGLRVSLCKYALEKYAPLDGFLNARGREVTIPRGVAGGSKLTAIFDKDAVRVCLTRGRVALTGVGPDGEYGEERKVDYAGPDMAFSVPPKVLADLVGRSTRCEVTPVSLRVNGGNYIYVAALEAEK